MCVCVCVCVCVCFFLCVCISRILIDWVGKVINWELSKRLKIDHIGKLYIHKQEFIPENETHKIIWDFEIPNGTPSPGPKTRPSINYQKEKSVQSCGFCCSCRLQSKK